MSSYLSGDPITATFSEEFLGQIVENIEALVVENSHEGVNTIVSISGGSCTGKSTIISKGIMERLSIPFTFLDQDTFQNNPNYQSNFDQTYRWDHPNNFSIGECSKALVNLRNNVDVIVPDYSFKTDEPIGKRKLTPTSLILFEGLYASYQNLAPESDLIIYAEAPFYVRLIRRIFRNTMERYRDRDPALILKGFIASVTDAHEDFVRSQRENADAVVQMPFEFSDLIKRFSLAAIEGKVHFDWCTELHGNIKIGLHTDGTFTLIYEGKKYLEFEIDKHSLEKLKQLDWFAF